MIEILYTFIIYPLVQIIELAFLFANKLAHNTGISIFGVSIVVSLLTLPLYFIAEKYQQKERNIQNDLKQKIEKIKLSFSGDERFMILQTFYKQHHYHPVYAMRSTFGLLIQIPFFIAAYTYLSHLDALNGASFFFITNLGAPDGITRIGSFTINVLPIAMTIINIFSGAVYTHGLPLKEKIQLYVMALIFLALLYNSPAGLVLYWTVNNIFSLAKNIVQKAKYRKKIIKTLICVTILFLSVYILFFHQGYLYKRLIVVAISLFLFFAILFFNNYKNGLHNLAVKFMSNNNASCQTSTFVFSTLILFLLIGWVIPSTLIASSVQEFSFIETYTSPLPFLFNTINQSAGFFIFWSFCVYFLLSKQTRKFFTLIITIYCVLSLANTFLFSGNYGFMTVTLNLSNLGTSKSNIISIIYNCAFLVLIFAFVIFLLLIRNKRILLTLQIIVFMSLCATCFINTVNIQKEFSVYAQLVAKDEYEDKFSPVYTFSKTKNNVLVIMLDRAMPGYLPYILEEKPELTQSFSGFVWYPNTISFGEHTIYGTPGIFGGYEYTPLEMQKRNKETLVEKHNQSILVMPSVFLDAGFSVTITDPSWANYSWKPDLYAFDDYPQVKSKNILGAYNTHWRSMNPDVKTIDVSYLLKNNLIRFSFFKTLPVLFRFYFYNDGHYLTTKDFDTNSNFSESVLNSYAALDILPQITKIETEGSAEFMLMVNELPHGHTLLQKPDYTPAVTINNADSNAEQSFSNEQYYHSNIASYLLLEKWFAFLKANDVYNNTRIIIVSDHGDNIYSKYPNNIILPNGECLQAYNAMLLVKDFNSQGYLRTDDSFMTNADVPYLAMNDIIKNPINPFTQIPIKTQKENGVTITTAHHWEPNKNGKYMFDIKANEWLHVHNNIFDPANWKKTP